MIAVMTRQNGFVSLQQALDYYGKIFYEEYDPVEGISRYKLSFIDSFMQVRPDWNKMGITDDHDGDDDCEARLVACFCLHPPYSGVQHFDKFIPVRSLKTMKDMMRFQSDAGVPNDGNLRGIFNDIRRERKSIDDDTSIEDSLVDKLFRQAFDKYSSYTGVRYEYSSPCVVTVNGKGLVLMKHEIRLMNNQFKKRKDLDDGIFKAMIEFNGLMDVLKRNRKIKTVLNVDDRRLVYRWAAAESLHRAKRLKAEGQFADMELMDLINLIHKDLLRFTTNVILSWQASVYETGLEGNLNDVLKTAGTLSWAWHKNGLRTCIVRSPNGSLHSLAYMNAYNEALAPLMDLYKDTAAERDINLRAVKLSTLFDLIRFALDLMEEIDGLNLSIMNSDEDPYFAMFTNVRNVFDYRKALDEYMSKAIAFIRYALDDCRQGVRQPAPILCEDFKMAVDC